MRKYRKRNKKIKYNIGKEPNDLDCIPEVRYVLAISYHVNFGLNEGMTSKAIGEVSEIFGDDEFLGFQLEVRETTHGDDIEEIDVIATNSDSELNVYARDNNGKEYK